MHVVVRHGQARLVELALAEQQDIQVEGARAPAFVLAHAALFQLDGLQGVELVCIGYNTPVHNPPAPEHDRLGDFHNHLVMQSGAYQNGTWVVGVAKAGDEEGVPMIGGSCIIAPSGEIVARCTTLGDEVQITRCDLDLCTSYKTSIFNFAKHRRPEHYGLIVARTGAGAPLGVSGAGG